MFQNPTNSTPSSHTNRKVHQAWRLVLDNIRPWRNSPQIRTATVRNTGDSLTVQGAIYDAFQLRCPEFLSCHSLGVPEDADLYAIDIALGTTKKETPCNTHTAMWHKHCVCNNLKKCDQSISFGVPTRCGCTSCSVTGLNRSFGGSRRLRLPAFLYIRHVKVARLSALRTGLLYPQDKCRCNFNLW
jgi:hypothetical protein